MTKASLKDGRQVVIREAHPNDAAAFNELVKAIISTSPYTLTTVGELDSSTETQVERIEQYREGKGQLMLVAEYDGQLVGTLDFKNNHKLRNRHWGEFGMGLRPEFRSLGLGRILLQELLHWAEVNPLIEKVCLGVFADNTIGLRLYRGMGFLEEGRWIKAIKLGPGQYADEIRMYKMVGKG